MVSATEIRTVAELLQVSPEGLQKAITFKVTVSVGLGAQAGRGGPWSLGITAAVAKTPSRPWFCAPRPGNAAGEDFYPPDCRKCCGCQVEGRGNCAVWGHGGCLVPRDGARGEMPGCERGQLSPSVQIRLSGD